ncbi:ATP-binding protein [Lacrimispora amygdalina]|uniref:ATP-binding protein n=1 Tax=Lacrimispora amygdalina TaxID=253257 RepID=UPI000BE3F693|nr:ATP-binding protein [Lacrimispora amygdalina]
MFESMNYKQITINPRIINHLGKNLITTSDVAVVELVKNSIDAKSSCINLLLFENKSYLEQGNNFITPLSKDVFDFLPNYCLNTPFLIVEDNGKGMNNEQLDRGFLEIGTDIKLDNTEGITLGEKGIGRLAAQRLGRYLLVETASRDEDYATLTFVDWENIVNPSLENVNGTNYRVPYKRIDKINCSYTRLWIFDININDFLDTPAQLVLNLGLNTNMVVNSNLKSALNFLISPFSHGTNLTNIQMFYNNNKIGIDFPEYMLNLSESIHSFVIEINEDNKIKLNYSLLLKPWFIERVHRVLVKPEAFKRLKKSHVYYKELLEDNKDKIKKVLSRTIDEEELTKIVTETYDELYSVSIKNKQNRLDFACLKAEKCIQNLKRIIPIKGEIYTFKQNSAVGQNIIIDTVQELYEDTQYSLKQLKRFLDDYNGIKLYRDVYRIGFLGDKENDWIKLQQFRTKGQQWYRFDLGNTLGFVSVNDPDQINIQEISSRLDISQNEVSDAFKDLINIVFNKLFYEINRKSNSIVKSILEQRGLLGESLTKRVKKNTSTIDNAIRRNKQIMKSMQNITAQLERNVKIDGESAFIPLKIYNMVEQVFRDTSDHFVEDEKAQTQAVNLLAEADEQLKAIEVESYNNYKLMANGLITETITHELHSISKTGIESNIDNHFEYLKGYFVENGSIPIYNQHLYPIKTNYGIVSCKLNEVGNLYSFLENTFVKKGTYDEFVNQKIQDIVDDIQQNLLKIIKDNDIEIDCITKDLTWFVPKGVLIHVFYNLINNSIYWIDKRRKFAELDELYNYDQKDKIIIEEFNSDAIVVFDTGTGIINNMEDILFEPLESGKPSGEGRGMGLYIVRQLLRSFNADIELLPDRNYYGNRYKFLITIETEEIYQNGFNTNL